MRYALIRDGEVENVILWDGVAELNLPEDVSAIDCPDEVSPGWLWNNADGFSAPASAQGPNRVTKADFQRLLLPAERYAINALRKTISGLTVADYSNPDNGLILAAEDVLLAFEQPAEFIELNHPDTFAGLTLFSYLGILSSERVAAIIGE